MASTWVVELRPVADTPVQPMFAPHVLERATAVLGPGPVAWAAQIGDQIAERVTGDIPAMSGSHDLAVVRGSMQSAVVHVLVAMLNGELPGDADVGVDAIPTIHESVAARVPLTTVYVSLRQGHSMMVELIMDACRQLVPLEQQPDQLRFVSDTSFQFVDKLAANVARIYEDEERRWKANPQIHKLRLVERLLSAGTTDHQAVSASLSYPLDGRSHLGVLAWTTTRSPTVMATLSATATALLREAGAVDVMVVRERDWKVWAWGSRVTDFPSDLAVPRMTPGGVRLTVGEPGCDVSGFIDTHRQAVEAYDLASRLPTLTDPVIAFHDVNLLALLMGDPQRAQAFVIRELGEMAKDDDQMATLRETLEEYLDSHSPHSAAQKLYVVRNTVSYRLRRAESILGRPVTARQPELRVALMLARFLIAPTPQRKT